MAFLSSLNISGSALNVAKLRMEVVSQNIANADTTVSTAGGAYGRKRVVLGEKNGRELNAFYDEFTKSVSVTEDELQGVEVREIVVDQDAFIMEYDPTNPLADEQGYVMRPEINTVEEMIEMMSASRSYEANITVFNAVKDMASEALTIGK